MAKPLGSTSPSEVSQKSTSLHTSSLAELGHDTNVRHINMLERSFELNWSSSPVVDSAGTHGNQYALFIIDLNIIVRSITGDKGPKNEQR